MIVIPITQLNKELKDFFEDFIESQVKLVSSWHEFFAKPLSWKIEHDTIKIDYGQHKSGSKNSEIERIIQILFCLENNFYGSSKAKKFGSKLCIFPDIFRVEKSRKKRKVEDEKTIGDLLRKGKLPKAKNSEIKSLLKRSQYTEVLDILIEKRPIADKSFFDLLLEAEQLDTIHGVFRYKVIHNKEKKPLLELDQNYKDPLIHKKKRSDLVEVWESIIGEGYTSKQLILSDTIPYPALGIQDGDTITEISYIDLNKGRIRLAKTPKIPKTGYCFFYDFGTQILYDRKRFLGKIINENIEVKKLLQAKVRPFSKNKLSREDLINRIISKNGLYCVQGPPGTGKTYLASEVISQYIKANPKAKILVSSKEHFALDNLLLSCMDRVEEGMLRPLRLLSKHKSSHLNNPQIEPFLVRKQANTIRKIKTWKTGEAIVSDFPDNRIAFLTEELANIVFTTTMDSSIIDMIERKYFDLVVIEETGKCYPSELLHLMVMGSTVLMIGDQHQLPPFQVEITRNLINTIEKTIHQPNKEETISQRFGEEFLKLRELDFDNIDTYISWLHPFKQIFERIPDNNRYRLQDQYRMPENLSNIIGEVFYGEKFRHKKQQTKSLKVYSDLFSANNLVWINTPHMLDFNHAAEENDRGQRSNAYEIELIEKMLGTINFDKDPEIVILTPYNEQKRKLLDSTIIQTTLQEKYGSSWENLIRSIDEFQGHEADITIISLVRNNLLNMDTAWGFISNPQRLNVMFSRAREGMVIVGSQDHIERNKEGREMDQFYSFLQQFQNYGVSINSEEISHE